jgi:uncharacterized protein (TIGR03086 family)
MAKHRKSTPGEPVRVAHLAGCVLVTEDVVGGVTAEQGEEPTPCPEMDVHALVDHLVGFAASFADRAEGVSPATDPTSVSAGLRPREAYHEQAVRLVEAYSGDGPAEGAVPLAIAVIETVCHGWDLAVATGQPTRYPDEAVEAALEAAQGFMKPEFRGVDQSFGAEVPVPASAPALDRLVGFMGRDPGWKPPV